MAKAFGVMAIDFNTAGVTVKVAALETTVPDVAVIVALPGATARA